MAHLTVCTIALIVLRLIQRQVNHANPEQLGKDLLYGNVLSADRIQTALNKWKIERIGDTYFRFCDVDDPDLSLILESFGVVIPKKCFKISEVLQLKSMLNMST